jgi:hypothetical protein
MMLKRVLPWVVAAVLFLLPGVVNAASVFLAVTSGTWNNAANWVRVNGSGANNYPVAGDTALISGVAMTVDGGSFAAAAVYLSNEGDLQVTSGDTLTMGTCYILHAASTLQVDGTAVLTGLLVVACGEVVVNNGGTFNIYGSVELAGTFTVNSGGVASISGGTFDNDSLIQLNGGTFEVHKGVVEVDAGATFRMNGGRLEVNVTDGFRLLTMTSVLEVKADASIGGTGSLIGDDVNAAIALNVEGCDDVELTLDPGAQIHGAGTFLRCGYGAGLAKLRNQGQIKADYSGLAIILDASLDEISDGESSCSSPNWYVHTGSVLEFDRSATSLTGDFRICGVLLVYDTVTTSGKKKVTGGAITGPFTATGGDCP